MYECSKWLFVSVLTTLLMSCNSSEPRQKLIITGSSTVAPLVAELAAAYEAAHPNVRIDVQSGGSSRGVNDVRKHLADIGMVSRALKGNEAELTAHTIAWDGIALILHRDNPVEALSDSQVVDIYNGTIHNWSAVGGPDQAITVVNKAAGRSTLELFLHYFKLDNRHIKADVIMGDNQQGLKLVEGNQWAVAYVSIGAASYEESIGADIKLLAVNNIEANLSNVEQGQFPIARPLNLVTNGRYNELADTFIAYAQSAVAGAVIRQQFFIPAHAQ